MSVFSARKLIVIALAITLAACGSSKQPSATPSTTVALVPYQTITAGVTEGPEESVERPQPTPTAFIYTIVSGDTLFTIAARFGIELDALRAANPGVDERLLAPGATIIIPAAGVVNATALPSPTPVALEISAPRCYATAAGELWCFVLAVNDRSQSIENIIGVVQLLSASGEVLASIEAAPPLNLLTAGESMPLVAYLQNPPQGWVSVRAQLLSAYGLAENDQIYLATELQNAVVDISPNGLSARVGGVVSLPGGQSASSIWVLAVAYGADGSVVGVRRWESTGSGVFSFWVYSLGPKIAEVELLVEARP
ncbi:MAG: LysM peptidoglycan-binding domain-containing protein [Anaerolineales bacterium]